MVEGAVKPELLYPLLQHSLFYACSTLAAVHLFHGLLPRIDIVFNEKRAFYLTPSYLSSLLHTALTAVTYYSPNFASEKAPFMAVLWAVVSGSVAFMRSNVRSGMESLRELERQRAGGGGEDKKKK